MKALFVTGLWPNAQNTYRGIFVKEHALALANCGNEVQVLSIEVYTASSLLSTHFKIETTSEGLQIWHAQVYSRFPKIAGNLRWLLWWLFSSKIKSEVTQFKPDVLVGNFIHPAGVLAFFISKATQVPFYLIEHWSGFEKHLASHPEAKWSKEALKKAGGIATVSKFLASTVSRYVEAKKITVIPNVINEEVFKLKNPLSNYSDNEQIRLVSVMNLSYPKRPELVAEALNIWATQNLGKSITWKIAGTGALKAAMEQMLTAQNIRVEFLGPVSKAKLAQEYSWAHFTLHPTDYETFGVVPIESVLCGTPVIASKVAALPENISEGINGVLIENTVESWVKAFQNAFSQNWNPEKVRSSVLNKYGPSVIGKSLETFLQKNP